MKKKLFGNNIKPSCKYCELGTAMGDDKIQCSKFGVVKSTIPARSLFILSSVFPRRRYSLQIDKQYQLLIKIK
ncbi:MAG: hypothetical protein ACLS48_00665 [[Eubacterium] siraeum]